MVETKQYFSPEGNNLNNLTDKHKKQASNTKRYRGKKTRTKTQGLELEAYNDFKGQYIDP